MRAQFLFVTILGFTVSPLWASTQLECQFTEMHGDAHNMIEVGAVVDSDGNAILTGQSTFNKNITFFSSTNRLNRMNLTITDTDSKVSALNSVRDEKYALVAMNKSGTTEEWYKLNCSQK